MTTLRASFLFALLVLTGCAAGNAVRGERGGGGGGGGMGLGPMPDSPRNVEARSMVQHETDDRGTSGVAREPMGIRDVTYCRVCSQ
jgi:hypothetical protein